MKFTRREKLLQRLLPYWCPHCMRRFVRESSFHKHYFGCNERYQLKMNEKLGLIAPKNRAERRAMAKKAGQIKDWSKLNG